MVWQALYRWIDQQHWLEPVTERGQQVVQSAYAAGGPVGQQVKDFLHGTWFGHPLHPALVAVPLGSWSAALVFDVLDTLTGEDRFAGASEAAIGFGLAGGAAAAASGLTDWSATDPPARRLGFVHGAMNAGLMLVYGGSLALRLTGAQGAGRALSSLGFLAGLLSAHFGGELVYGRRIGVDHAKGEAPPGAWTAVLAEAELPPNQPKQVDAQGASLVLVRQGGQVYALSAHCAHLGGPLAEGEVGEGRITCPWHGSTYSLADGGILAGPSTFPQPCYEARIMGRRIEVRSAQNPAG